MNRIIKLISVLLLAVFLTTGCTERFIDKDTEKSYTSNILCKPTTEEMKEVYDNNKKEVKVDIDKLPECSEFKITSGEYENLFTSLINKISTYASYKEIINAIRKYEESSTRITKIREKI